MAKICEYLQKYSNKYGFERKAYLQELISTEGNGIPLHFPTGGRGTGRGSKARDMGRTGNTISKTYGKRCTSS